MVLCTLNTIILSIVYVNKGVIFLWILKHSGLTSCKIMHLYGLSHSPLMLQHTVNNVIFVKDSSKVIQLPNSYITLVIIVCQRKVFINHSFCSQEMHFSIGKLVANKS